MTAKRAQVPGRAVAMPTFTDEASKGDTGHAKSKARAAELFDEWRLTGDEAHALAPKKFAKLGAQELCRPVVIDTWAHWLVVEYESKLGRNKDHNLALGTALDYLGLLLNQMKDRFEATGDADIKLFFTCLQSKADTKPAQWLQKLKAEMVRHCYESAKQTGEEMDQSVEPIYREHLELIDRAFAREGSAQVEPPPPLCTHTHAHTKTVVLRLDPR